MTLRPARGLVLCRLVESQETFSGGKIILPQSVRDGMTAYQVTILAVGEPEVCDDPSECDRLHVTVGDAQQHVLPPSLVPSSWCLVKPRSFVPISETDDRFFVRQSEVEGIFDVRE